MLPPPPVPVWLASPPPVIQHPHYCTCCSATSTDTPANPHTPTQAPTAGPSQLVVQERQLSFNVTAIPDAEFGLVFSKQLAFLASFMAETQHLKDLNNSSCKSAARNTIDPLSLTHTHAEETTTRQQTMQRNKRL